MRTPRRSEGAPASIPGLGGPVQITTDRWGVPHIVAMDARDAFAGQGYAQARLRLFQIDLWRRRGRGLLAEVLGPDAVRLDVAARMFVSRHPVDAQLAGRPARDADRLEAFVRGVNAHVAEVASGRVTAPPEFAALGWEPEPLEVADLLQLRIHGMNANAEEELARALTLRDHGAAIERLRRLLEPPHEPMPSEVDPALLHDGILAPYRAAREPVRFAGATPRTASSGPDGSNNWAIAGSRTRSGRPIVANDPHRIMTFPSLRTLVHLRCPDFDVIGMNEPYMPGITAGHNADVAWGITIAPADLEDLHVYELDETGDAYRYGGGWRAFEVVEERFPVRGGSSRTHVLRFTVHGPVLSIDRARRTAVALRAAWLEPGMAPYLGAIDLLEARDLEDHRERLAGWGNPVLNVVAADTAGRIGWQVAGRIPQRSGWDGLLPVPGDGRFEWSGSRTAPDLPGVVDPAQGWLRSANQYNLDEDPDWRGEPTGYEWYAGYRARRIAETLSGRADWTVEAAAALQGDDRAIPLDDVRPFLRHPLADPDAEFARVDIAAWDGRMAVDSRAAALFDRWLYVELPAAIRLDAAHRLVGGERAAAAVAVLLDRSRQTVGDARTDIALLAALPEAQAGDVVRVSLAAAVAWLRSHQGPDADTWNWGRMHVSRLVHPLAGIPGIDREVADTGAHPKPGSSDTVGVAFGADGVQTLGAATRLVMDVGDWDASLFINAPGQDGRLDGAHVRDLYDRWLADRYVPLLFTRERIAEAAESAMTVLPAPAP